MDSLPAVPLEPSFPESTLAVVTVMTMRTGRANTRLSVYVTQTNCVAEREMHGLVLVVIGCGPSVTLSRRRVRCAYQAPGQCAVVSPRLNRGMVASE